MNIIIPQRSQLQSFLVHEAPGLFYLHSKASPVSHNVTSACLDLSLGGRAKSGSGGRAEHRKAGLRGERLAGEGGMGAYDEASESRGQRAAVESIN